MGSVHCFFPVSFQFSFAFAAAVAVACFCLDSIHVKLIHTETLSNLCVHTTQLMAL